MKFGDKYSQATQSTFISSVKGMANTLAVAVTFFTVPILFRSTSDWVRAFTVSQYGPDWTDLVLIGWFVICVLFVFFVSRASLSTALIMGGLALAARVL